MENTRGYLATWCHLLLSTGHHVVPNQYTWTEWEGVVGVGEGVENSAHTPSSNCQSLERPVSTSPSASYSLTPTLPIPVPWPNLASGIKAPVIISGLSFVVLATLVLRLGDSSGHCRQTPKGVQMAVSVVCQSLAEEGGLSSCSIERTQP